MIRSLSSIWIRNYCDTDISTLCTVCSCWRHFEADRRLLLPWKRNLEVGLMWKMTWFVLCEIFTYSASNIYAF